MSWCTRVSPIDRLTATSHVVEMPLEKGPQEPLPVPFVQLSIILDLAKVAARITEPSDAANAMSSCTTIGVGEKGRGWNMYVRTVEGKTRLCFWLCTDWVCSSGGRGGHELVLGFRVFSLMQILPR